MVGVTLRQVDRNSPWSILGSWSRDFENLFNDFDRNVGPFVRSESHESQLRSACDIHETDSEYLLSLDMPGVAKEDINIEYSGNNLILSAERKQEKTLQGVTTHRIERSYGSIKRTFTLPEGVDAEKVQANYENGVLYLSIPKIEAKKPTKIEIGTGKAGFLKNLVGKASEKAKAMNS